MRPLALFLFLLLIVTGCAQSRTPASSFLANVQQLEETGNGDDLAYLKPGTNWNAYHYMVLDHVKVSPPSGETLRVTPKEEEELRRYLRQAMVESLRHRFTETTSPGPGTVRVRAALTEVGQALPWFNIPMAILAYPVDYGGASIEVEIVDSQTNQRLAAFMASRTGDLSEVIEHFTWLGHARRSIYRAAERLRIMIDESAAPSNRPQLSE